MCLCDKVELGAETEPSEEKICKDGKSTDYSKNKDFKSVRNLVLRQFWRIYVWVVGGGAREGTSGDQEFTLRRQLDLGMVTTTI